jgi:hypothetical protein
MVRKDLSMTPFTIDLTSNPELLYAILEIILKRNAVTISKRRKIRKAQKVFKA